MTGETAIRQSIIDACARMNATGLNQGTSGNISLRHKGGLLITPTTMSYDVMVPSDIAFLPALARDGCDGPRPPSSEWRFHRDIYAARPEIGAIVHTHSTYATVLSMLRLPIPAAHYMIAVFGGNDIRCSDYATFGTPELSAVVLKALKSRFGALIGTHGMVACGADLAQAMWRTEELETLARQYYLARQAGNPVTLDAAEISRVAGKMSAGYGNSGSEEKE